MSHYTVAVITEQKPTEEQIEEILAPFDEGLSVEPYISYPYETVKEELRKNFCNPAEEPDEIEMLHALEDDDIEKIREINEEWNYYEDIDENGNAISTYNPNSKWDWYEIGGRWRNFLNGEKSVRLSEHPKDRNCYAVLTPDGKWHESGRMWWWGFSMASKEEQDAWPENYWKIINSFPKDYYITVVDCHI